MGTDQPAVFMHASGPWEVAKVWRCGDCSAHGDLQWFHDIAPRAHVADSGHTVTLTKTEEMTLFPVNTQPPG